MPEIAVEPESRNAPDFVNTNPAQKPGFIVPVILVAAAIALGVLTVVFDWGWVTWMLALGVGALGLFVLSAAIGTTNRMLIVGGIAAVAVVVGGVAAVRLQPHLPAGFAIGDSEEVVGRSGDTIVVAGKAGNDGDDGRADEREFGVRGLSLSGDELWTSTGSADDENDGDTGKAEPEPGVTVVDDVVVVVADDDSPNSEGSLVTGFDATTGEQVWSRQLPAASELQTATRETLVFSAPTEGTSALYLATGILRWSSPENNLTTYRVGDFARIDDRVAVPNEQSWALLEPDEDTPSQATTINLDSGELGPEMDLGEADYAMVGAVLVTQEYEGVGAGRTLVGTSVDGRVGWTRLVSDFVDSRSLMDAVDGDLRVLLPTGAAVITATNGELTMNELPKGWEYSGRALALHARYELAYSENDGPGAFDTMTGELVSLPGRGTLDTSRSTAGDSGESVLDVQLVDAVGGRAFRYDAITDGGAQTIYADSGEADWNPGVLQIGRRVIPIG